MGQAKTIQIDRSLVRLDPEEISRSLGIPEGEDDVHTRQVIVSQIDRCLELMEPKGGYTRIPAVHTGSQARIAIPGSTFRTGKIIGSQLHLADEFVFFMGTAGPEPEALSKKLLDQGDYLEGLVTNLVASAIAEWVAGHLHAHITSLAEEEGTHATNRYSPGYCNWQVNEQQTLFSLFPEGFCGISLSLSSLMSPIKSVSGVIGLGKDVSFNDYVCDECTVKNCAYRKKHTFYHSD